MSNLLKTMLSIEKTPVEIKEPEQVKKVNYQSYDVTVDEQLLSVAVPLGSMIDFEKELKAVKSMKDVGALVEKFGGFNIE